MNTHWGQLPGGAAGATAPMLPAGAVAPAAPTATGLPAVPFSPPSSPWVPPTGTVTGAGTPILTANAIPSIPVGIPSANGWTADANVAAGYTPEIIGTHWSEQAGVPRVALYPMDLRQRWDAARNEQAAIQQAGGPGPILIGIGALLLIGGGFLAGRWWTERQG